MFPRHGLLRRGCRAAALCSGLALGACDGSTAPDRGAPGIEISAGRDVSDTVFAPSTLRVRVRDESGRLAAGQVVRFESVPVAGTSGDLFDHYRAFIAAPEPQHTTTFRADTTDDAGEAAVPIRIGVRPGVGYIRIRVPTLGYADSARYDVAPGAVVGATVEPSDSAVFAGNGYRLRAHAVDRLGNPRSDPVRYTVAYGPASVEPNTGTVTGTSIGRAAIVVEAQGRPDTAYVTIVPEAWIAAQEFFIGNGGPKGIFLMRLDGSERQLLGPGIDNVFIPQGFGWSPDGRELATADETFIRLVAPGGAQRLVAEMSGPVMTSARFSRDGNWVYFAHAGTRSQSIGLWRVRVDGSELTHVGPASLAILPSPSHDGASVAYVSYRGGCGQETCIRIVDPATRQDRTIGGRDYLAPGTAVAWSSVDDLLAYHGGTRVLVVRSDGTGERVLADGVPRVTWMEWSPDGRWLIVSGGTIPLLIDTETGTQLPLGHLISYRPIVWRP